MEYNIIEILGWLGTASILFGYYLNAKKLEMSWVVWFLGNLFMSKLIDFIVSPKKKLKFSK